MMKPLLTRPIWHDLPKPWLFLAPMAGYTESCFRRLVREIEPSVILTSELVSAEALRRGSEKTKRLMAFSPAEKHYYGVQLFGNEASAFVDAGQMVADMGADFIDINLGCPSPKVVGSGHGSALLQNPDSTADMIAQVVQKVSLPVTVKMRLGFYNHHDLLSVVQNFIQAGISSLAIHGRTAKQKFTGVANWDPIYAVKKAVSIPIIGNGDVTSVAIAAKKLRNLDGLMIGRAALRNPWLFRAVRQHFSQLLLSPPPSLQQRLNFFRRHLHLAITDKGERWAVIEMRKHFSHFTRSLPRASQFRARLMQADSLSAVEQVFADMLQPQQ